MTDDENNKIINEAFEDITPEELELQNISFDVAERIHDILDDRNMTQKDLAALLDKKESEVSRWLTGMHNFTTKTIAKLQVALDTKIITVPRKNVMAKKDLPPAMKNDPAGMGIHHLRVVHPTRITKQIPSAA